MKSTRLSRFLTAILICEGAGLLGAFVTAPAIGDWYQTLRKPPWIPPDWVFGPVWTTLFFLMGIALFLVWEKHGRLVWFWRQLGLNVLWSIIFFGWHSPKLALVEIIVLWIAILLTIKEVKKSSENAAWLLAPYLLWVSVAVALNASIVNLNSLCSSSYC